jgi:hypothetical protein
MSKLERLLGELAGSASLCWEPRPTGVFDSTEAQKFVADCKLAILEVVREIVPKKKQGNDGKGCICGARYYGECGCPDVDWNDFTEWNNCCDDINSKIGKEMGE